MCLVEFVGPCRFSHFDALGMPVAKAELDSLVQVAATAQEQTKNTSKLFLTITSREFMRDYAVTPFSASTERIRARDGRQEMVMVTSNPRSLEGNRSTFVLLNETHHWNASNNGILMYETIWGNTAKGGGRGSRFLAITNAFLPGEDSVAERLRDEYDSLPPGGDLEDGILYDSIEAHELVPMHPVALEQVVPIIRGDAWWLDVVSILRAIRKKSIPASRSRRMWLNQIRASEDALYSPAQWNDLETSDALRRGDEICLGFDGSRTNDSTALVAIRVADDLVVPLGIWEKDGDNWQVPRDAVRSTLAEAFKTYEVKGFFCDVEQWEDETEDWHLQYGPKLAVKANATGNAVQWDMRNSIRATRAHERLMASVINAKLKWSSRVNPELVTILRRHVGNTYRDENAHGVYFRKVSRMSSRKIDAYAAMLCAHEALAQYRLKGKKTFKPQPGRVWGFR